LWEFAKQAQDEKGAGKYFQDAVAIGGQNLWHVLEVYFTVITNECYRLLIARWANVLGGVDVVGHDHCWTLTEHYRVN